MTTATVAAVSPSSSALLRTFALSVATVIALLAIAGFADAWGGRAWSETVLSGPSLVISLMLVFGVDHLFRRR